MTFNVSGGAFDTTAPVLAYVNGSQLPESSVFVSAGSVFLWNVLTDGKTDIEIEGQDTATGIINERHTFWGGSRAVTVTVRNQQNQPVADVAVGLGPAEDWDVYVWAYTNGAGQAVFSNAPSGKDIIVFAVATGLRITMSTLPPGTTTAVLIADIDNPDFSQGASGWTVASPNQILLLHSEASQPLVPCPTCPWRPTLLAGSQVSSPPPAAGAGQNATTADYDLRFSTMATTQLKSASRTFTARRGSTYVKVRYRFQTDEIGSGGQPNDTFEVRISNTTAGTTVRDFKTVGTLMGQWDANGATPWRALELPAAEGDRIIVTAAAQNIGDNAYAGWIYIDAITEESVEIVSFDLLDMIEQTIRMPGRGRTSPSGF